MKSIQFQFLCSAFSKLCAIINLYYLLAPFTGFDHHLCLSLSLTPIPLIIPTTKACFHNTTGHQGSLLCHTNLIYHTLHNKYDQAVILILSNHIRPNTCQHFLFQGTKNGQVYCMIELLLFNPEAKNTLVFLYCHMKANNYKVMH